MPWVGNNLYKPKSVIRKPKRKMISGIVKNVAIISGGICYKSGTNISTLGGNGPQHGQFNCKVDITTSDKGVVTGISIHSGGFGYNINDILTVNSGTKECKIRVMKVTS